MAGRANVGSFKISHAPLASSAVGQVPESEDPAEPSPHRGAPLLLAIARNPSTLFVCWSVDWPSAFGAGVPADRAAHLKLKGRDSEHVRAVEPLSGNFSIHDLEPGGTYLVELGYYAPADCWNVIAAGHEVMMPLAGQAQEPGAVDVATIPFHLTFEGLARLLGDNENMVETVAVFEQRMVEDPVLNEKDEQFLRALDLSRHDLRNAAAIREALIRSKKRSQTAAKFGQLGGSSRGP